MSREPISNRIFIERLVIAIAVIGLALLLWNLRGLLMLVFGAVLVSVILSLVAQPLRQRLNFPDWAALTIAILLVAATLVTAFWTFGAQLIRQADSLKERIPEAWDVVVAQLERWGLEDIASEWTSSVGEGNGVVSSLGNIAMTVGNGIADTVLVIIGGIYLAAQPQLYRVGILKLVPERGRALAAQALDASGRGLKLWLAGRLISMIAVGTLTWLGLVLIGVPSALALGLLAALLEFIPFLGPIAAAVPAILLAFAESPQLALWTGLLFLLIQQIEGNVLEPLVQQRAVDLPPALLIFALVAGGLVFGLWGVVLAAPATVVIFILVKRLYVVEALSTPTSIPGDRDKRKTD